MYRNNFMSAVCALILTSISTLVFAETKVTVFAAASLTNAVNQIAADYEKEKSVSIQSSFAASSALAKQIENGAPADIFISADSKWVNYLQDKKRISSDSRVDLLSNHLVMIAPKGKAFKVQTDKTFNFANAFYGKLCTGEIESVPAGVYAKQSLVSLKWWDQIKSRIVGTQDVRATLVFVERGECDVGIVYETDAKVSSKVEVIAMLPDESHDPIIYPFALVQGAKPEAKDFFEYLKSEKARAVFLQYGFMPITK